MILLKLNSLFEVASHDFRRSAKAQLFGLSSVLSGVARSIWLDTVPVLGRLK